MHEIRVIAAIELHVNATYYVQHPALKSVYGKRQSVMRSKLYSSYRTVFELAQGFWDSKTIALNGSYEVPLQKEALTICQDKVFASFLCVLWLSSVLGRFIILYCDTSSQGRSTPAWRVKPLSSPTFLIASYKLFLSDIKIEILINSWHFLMVLLDMSSAVLWLTPSVFSKWKILKWYTYRASFSDIGSVVIEF